MWFSLFGVDDGVIVYLCICVSTATVFPFKHHVFHYTNTHTHTYIYIYIYCNCRHARPAVAAFHAHRRQGWHRHCACLVLSCLVLSSLKAQRRQRRRWRRRRSQIIWLRRVQARTNLSACCPVLLAGYCAREVEHFKLFPTTATKAILCRGSHFKVLNMDPSSGIERPRFGTHPPQMAQQFYCLWFSFKTT